MKSSQPKDKMLENDKKLLMSLVSCCLIGTLGFLGMFYTTLGTPLYIFFLVCFAIGLLGLCR